MIFNIASQKFLTYCEIKMREKWLLKSRYIVKLIWEILRSKHIVKLRWEELFSTSQSLLLICVKWKLNWERNEINFTKLTKKYWRKCGNCCCETRCFSGRPFLCRGRIGNIAQKARIRRDTRSRHSPRGSSDQIDIYTAPRRVSSFGYRREAKNNSQRQKKIKFTFYLFIN